MDKPGRVLIVDDSEQWREELLETLERGGFSVNSASTAQQALERLNETFYHVLVLDIRLNETEPSNIDGIDLLKTLANHGLSEATKVVMLSAYGTQDRMRMAFREHKVVDFLSKDKFNNRMFLESIRQVFAEEVKINLGLDIHWQQVKGPEQVVLNLLIEGSRIKSGIALQKQIAEELDDLLCRLFYQAESILVRPLTPGQSGTGVLLIQPFYATGGGRAVVVKFGDFRKIEEEYHNFKEYVEPFVGGGRNTTIISIRRTPRLGGILYSLLGAANDQLEDFGSFYSHADISEINNALGRLFMDTCSAWYASPGRLQPHNLTADYQQLLGFTPEKLEEAFTDHLKSVQGKHDLHFNSLHDARTFTNPLLVLVGSPLIRPSYVCITHGDFNQHNILVDGNTNMWLIDFQGTGRGHILRDVAKLDAEVRFQLLKVDAATLEERLAMEEALCSINRFSMVEQLKKHFSTTNKALTKAYSTVVHLRLLARELVAQNRSDDMDEYYIALLYYALNTLRYYSLPSPLREHAVLSASLLVDRLRLKV